MAGLFINPADGLLYNNVRATSETHLDRLKVDLSIKRLMFGHKWAWLIPDSLCNPLLVRPTPSPLPLKFDE
ncbi:hypothetical protein GCM10027348_38860 [Hymenobacter tenuis]